MNIQDEVMQSLKPLAPRLVKELEELFLRTVDDDAYLISFEVQPSAFVARFPVRWDWLESDLGQLDGDQLLVDSGAILKSEHYEKSDPLPIAIPLLVEWFADRWQEAGGLEYRLPAFIERKDGEVMFDLKDRRWVQRSEAYPDF